MSESSAWSNRLLDIVGGQATTAQIEFWVDRSWRSGALADVVPLELLPELPSTGRPVRRYGDSGLLRSEICFVHAHGPGGVIVHAPAIEARSDGTVCPYVPLHVHQAAHLGVILRGEPHFFIDRGEPGEARVVRMPLQAGHLVTIPAGVAHSFGTAAAGFTILTIQARFVAPSEADFARNVRWSGEALPISNPEHRSASDVATLDG
jgi:hypothetical protein